MRKRTTPPTADRRDRLFTMRLNRNEYLSLADEANDNGLTIAAYILMLHNAEVTRRNKRLAAQTAKRKATKKEK